MVEPQIFVLDDDSAISAYIARALSLHGFETACFANSKAFCESGDVPPSAVILLDLGLEEDNGIAVLRVLAGRRCRAAILLMSGADPHIVAIAERLGRAYGLNIAGRLDKPFGLSDLIAAVTAAMPAGREPQQRQATPEEALHRAILAGELVLHYQPKIDIRSGAAVGCEALVRWQQPGRGLLAPAAFLPLAEKTGLIVPLTRRVLGEAIRQVAAWRDAGIEMPVAVNVPAGMLSDLALPKTVETLLAAHGVPGRHLTIEVTETEATPDLLTALDVLAQLRLMGVALSIDDFGTGHASFVKLRQLPFTEIKIDRMFVRDLAADTEARALTETMIVMAQRLGMPIVAEGVEDARTLDILLRMGCGTAQGYLFGKPMPAADFLPWVRNRAAEPMKMAA